MNGFPLENILNISLKDYLSIKGTSATDYTVEGVSNHKVMEKDKLEDGFGSFDPRRLIEHRIPTKTEVVINYEVTSALTELTSGKYVNALTVSGVALIPKAK